MHEGGVLIEALRRLVVAVRAAVAAAFGLEPRYVIPLGESAFQRTTSGKIMRAAMRAAFLRGTHARACAALDLALDSAPGFAFPDFFAAPLWVPRPPPPPLACGRPCVLLLAPPPLLASGLCEAIERSWGPGLRTVAAGGASEDELRTLFLSAAPSHIVHAALLTPLDESHSSDAASQLARGRRGDGGGTASGAGDACEALLSVARALRSWLGEGCAEPPARPTLLCVRYTADTAAPGALEYEASGAGLASALCKALAAELPSLARAAAVHVPRASTTEAIGSAVAAEARVSCALDMDVAYDEAGERRVQRYRTAGATLQSAAAREEQEPDTRGGEAPLLRPNGAYVVSGGLGGLGEALVRMILADEAAGGCSVLVLGRRPSRRGRKRLAELGWGGRVEYACVDLGADFSALRSALIGHLRRKAQPLAAVFHLAGSYQRAHVADYAPADLAAATRAKVWGAVHLHRAAIAAGERPAFVHFGSVATVYAGTGLGGYAGANAFLAWFACWQHDTAGLEARTIEWASWSGIGISQRDEALGMASWLAPLPLEQGLAVLRRLVASRCDGQRRVLVGVEPLDAELGCLFTDGPVGLTTPCLFYTPDVCPERALCVGRVPLCVPTLPTDKSGSVDVEALRTRPLPELLGRPRLAATAGAGSLAEASRLSTAAGVLDVVLETAQAVCGVPIDADGDLFDAGLSSLTSARLRGALQRRIGLELSSRLLLELSNVRALAASLFARLQASVAPRGEESATEHGAVEEEPALLAVKAAAMMRGGEMAVAEALVTRAAVASGLPLDEAGLQALLSPAATVQRPLPAPHASLLRLAAVLWMHRGEHARASLAYELLLAARPEALAAAFGLAIARQRQGSDTGVAEALTRASTAAHRYSAFGDAAAREAAALCAPSLVRTRIAEAASAAAPSAKSLVSLSLSRLGLAALPDAVMELRRLQRLDVSHNVLERLPESVERLGSLRELNASSNELSALPAGLAALPQLFVLALQRNRFAGVPEVALKCRRLRELKWGAQRRQLDGGCSAGQAGQAVISVAHADAGSLPTQLSTQLVTLEMEGNGASALPSTSPQNAYLGSVLASFNRLVALPPWLVRHGATLKKLHLGCNEIVSVADVLPSLLRLTELCLEGNRITELPADIGRLSRLRELWVHGNALDSLPDALGRCASLTVLQAHHNRLRELPEALAALRQLQGLYLQSNLLSDLPRLRASVLASMPLQNLALGANRFDLAHAFELPDCRVGLGWNAGEPPPQLPPLTDWFACRDHLFEPACVGVRGDVLLVAFSAQGPGVQQWQAPAAALRSSGLQLDVLFVADPSNSFYLQDPSGDWDGMAYFEALVRRHAARYDGCVLIVGSSMGATAALQHARLASRTLSFAPRVDLALSHGAFVPHAARAASLAAIANGLAELPASVVAVHVGAHNHVDALQVAAVPSSQAVHVVEHDTFHHNVPAHLESLGELVPLLRDEAFGVLRAHLSWKRQL